MEPNEKKVTMVKYEATDGQEVMLTPGIVAKYIVTGGGQVSDKELYSFMMKCKSRGLNPLAGDAYLVCYGGQASVIVSKDYFLRTASQQETFDGFKAGVVVLTKSGLEYREGTLYGQTQEQLVGGWAEVYDKRFRVPIKATVSLGEYSTGKSLWASKPATMIRKVALVQALREAYPLSYGGIYDADEMPDQYQSAPFEVADRQPAETPVQATVQEVEQPQPEPAQEPPAPEYYQDEIIYEDEDINF